MRASVEQTSPAFSIARPDQTAFGRGVRVCVAGLRQAIGFTSSLIPAFSPRRRRNARRLFEKPATGLAGQSSEKLRTCQGISFSLGGEGQDEGERQNKFSFVVIRRSSIPGCGRALNQIIFPQKPHGSRKITSWWQRVEAKAMVDELGRR